MATRSTRRVLFVPDVHRPFHDKRAWRLMLQVARKWKPHRIVVLGDFIDCLAVSFHEKSPARRHRLDWEVEDANEGLDELDALGADEKDFIRGNHCERFDRYVAQKCPELFGLLRLNDLLRLKDRGWVVTPYKQHRRVGKVWASHDFGSAGRTAHSKAIGDVLGNAVIGHVHSMGVTYAGSATGESHVGASFGWLGDVKAVDYMHRAKAHRDWHLGFGVGHMEEGGTVHLQAVPIIAYRCVVDGALYVG